MMKFKYALYKKIDKVVRIMQNRPEFSNAQNDQMLEELDEAFRLADNDADVRVIILGATGRHFCAGHDIGPESKPNLLELKDAGFETWESRERRIYWDYCMNIRNVSKPVIAEVHGLCITGGMMVAGMCDIIYASEDTEFMSPVARFTGASDEILIEPWAFGPRMAKECLWTGDPISAKEAWRLGFVNKVIPRQKLEEEVMNLAKRIALTPPMAVKLLKRSINRTVDLMGFIDALEYHYLAHELSHFTKESEEIFWKNLKIGYEKGMKVHFKNLNEPYENGETHRTTS